MDRAVAAAACGVLQGAWTDDSADRRQRNQDAVGDIDRSTDAHVYIQRLYQATNTTDLPTVRW